MHAENEDYYNFYLLECSAQLGPTWPNSFRSEEFNVKSGMSYVSVVFLFIMTI